MPNPQAWSLHRMTLRAGHRMQYFPNFFSGSEPARLFLTEHLLGLGFYGTFESSGSNSQPDWPATPWLSEPLRLHTQKQVQVDTVPEQPALFVGPRDIPWDAAPGTKKHRPTGWAGAVALTSWPSSQTTLKSEAEENGTDSSLFSHHLPQLNTRPGSSRPHAERTFLGVRFNPPK